MGFFNRKSTETAAVVDDGKNEIERLQEQMKPIQSEIRVLEQRRNDHQMKLPILQQQYDAEGMKLARGEDGNPLRFEDEARKVRSTISALDGLIGEKRRQLQPLESRFNELLRIEREQAEKIEADRFRAKWGRQYLEAEAELQAAQTRMDEAFRMLRNPPASWLTAHRSACIDLSSRLGHIRRDEREGSRRTVEQLENSLTLMEE